MEFPRAVFCIAALLASSGPLLAKGGNSLATFRESKGTLTIIDGEVATRDDFPYQAAIYLDYVAFCGGALISERWVLTTGHCVSGYSTWVVYLGASDLMLPKEKGRYAFVTRGGVLHPDYDFPYVDIALIELTRSVTTSTYIQPIDLPSNSSVSYVGDSAIASGWGKTSVGAITTSSRLMYVTLTVVDIGICQSTYFDPELGDAQLCAAGVGERGTCTGDSGGPLIYEDDDTKTLIGLASFGSKYGCEAGPDGFTNVAHFLSWISSTADV